MSSHLLAPTAPFNHQVGSLLLEVLKSFVESAFSLLVEVLVDLVLRVSVAQSLLLKALVDFCPDQFELALEAQV